MAIKRTERLNAMLQQVLMEVILREVKNPHLPSLVTVTQVEITSDLQHAKVYISVIGTPEQKKKAIEVLQSASGFIAAKASKRVVMRFFPALTFYLDETVEKQARVEEILNQIKSEEKKREQ
jgi:ribosome-binding factor A